MTVQICNRSMICIAPRMTHGLVIRLDSPRSHRKSQSSTMLATKLGKDLNAQKARDDVLMNAVYIDVKNAICCARRETHP